MLLRKATPQTDLPEFLYQVPMRESTLQPLAVKFVLAPRSAECGRFVLYSIRHFSITICASFSE